MINIVALRKKLFARLIYNSSLKLTREIFHLFKKINKIPALL